MGMMEEALKYARDFSWYVFPTREVDGEEYLDSTTGKKMIPIAKSPYISGGFRSASNDPAQIERWWKKHPNAGIGVSCGASHIYAIDIDNHVVGEKSGLEYFTDLGVPHKDCWMALTPNSGIHLIYADPDGIGKTTTNNDGQVDQRGVGGYIVLPPSYIYVLNAVERVEIIEGEEVTKIEMVKEKRSYTKIGEWKRSPMEIAPSYLELLNKGKSGEVIDLDFEEYLEGISKHDVERVFEAMRRMRVEVASDRGDWIAIGATLKMFGERGWKAFEWWTNKYLKEKPESKRVGTLKKTWNGFNRFGCRINTIFHHSPVPKNWRPSNG